jgi:hypothetical protein
MQWVEFSARCDTMLNDLVDYAATIFFKDVVGEGQDGSSMGL